LFARRDQRYGRHLGGGIESQVAPRPARAAPNAREGRRRPMNWLGQRDRALEAFAEAIRPELMDLRTPAASAELRERTLADRAAGARVILPVDATDSVSARRSVI